MAHRCGSCNVDTTRSSVTFDHKGRVVKEICPSCDPEYFAEPFRVPTDNRIYSGPQAMPHMYRRDKNDVYQAKDELLADTAALWDGGPTERAIRHKRATRRTEPMSAEEIKAANHFGEEVLAEAMRTGGSRAVAAILQGR